jgi:hypothetical protein
LDIEVPQSKKHALIATKKRKKRKKEKRKKEKRKKCATTTKSARCSTRYTQ